MNSRGSINRTVVMGTGTWAVPQEPVPMAIEIG